MVRQSCVQKSSKTESPQTRTSTKARHWRNGVSGDAAPIPGAALCCAAPRALAALHHHGASWQHPPLSAAHAPWREAPLLESSRCASFARRARPSASRASSAVVRVHWGAIHRRTRTLHSAAWRRVRSTRPREAATSFAFLQTLPCTGPQPIRAAAESSGGGTKAFKVVRGVNENVCVIICNSYPGEDFHSKCDVLTKSHCVVFSH